MHNFISIDLAILTSDCFPLTYESRLEIVLDSVSVSAISICLCLAGFHDQLVSLNIDTFQNFHRGVKMCLMQTQA